MTIPLGRLTAEDAAAIARMSPAAKAVSEGASPEQQAQQARCSVAVGSASAALADKIVTAIEGHFRDWLMSGEHAEAKQLVAELIAREYIGGLPPGAQVLKARAYQTDETFGYDRWVADQYSCGRGTRDALIVLLPNGRDEGRAGNA